PGKVSMTADGWSTDTTKESFLGMTGHWIEVEDGRWKLRSEVIMFRGITGEHSGQNLGLYYVALCERVGVITAKESKVCVEPCWCLNFDFVDICLAHVVNLATVAVIGHITKIATVENATAIWEYDPMLADNRVLNGSLDLVSAIRTLAIKIQASSQRIDYFEKLQAQCGITNPLKIPLHSNI
ncbi:hypothetical protein BD779DRAFT_1395460, partial [Infundibulicybe gibba]